MADSIAKRRVRPADDPSKRVQELERALKKRDVEASEIRHRVKNNMQMVIGLLKLQSRRLTDPSARQHFEDAAQRIQSLVLVQDEIHRQGDTRSLDLVPYFSGLVTATVALYGGPAIQTSLPSGSVQASLEKASPIGMAVNELLSNSLKFAFPEGRAGEISLGVRSLDDGRVEVSLADDGVGLPAGVFEDGTSLGLTLVKNLAMQADAELAVERKGGTRFTFTFAPQQE